MEKIQEEKTLLNINNNQKIIYYNQIKDNNIHRLDMSKLRA